MILRIVVSVITLGLVIPASTHAQGPLDPARVAQIDAVVEEGIRRGDCPGAVVLVLHDKRVVQHKAYGLRSRQPEKEPMTPDTLFDLASLTKPIATATSILLLVEEGKLLLGDRVAKHLPRFGQNGKERITVEHLLLHTSGLIADNAEADYRDGPDKARERIADLKPVAAPGERFIYSDVGYLVLGELVERLSGQRLDAFAKSRIFEPLGMKETGFLPQEALRPRVAPTQQREGRWMRGEVHDPRAYLMGGVAGHAGLFSTAEDLARYAQMILAGGTWEGRRVLSPFTVRLMTEPRAVPGGLRTYGWDMATSYSSNRGELFPRGVSFGHTGFTGTSLWIDPLSRSAVIFLSNRVHPDGKGNVTRLRAQVATAAAAALTTAPLPPATPIRASEVLTGIDVLAREKFARLEGKRVGLVTNHTGRDRTGQATIDLLHQAKGVRLVALFSPEHGIRGAVDEKVPDGKDDKTGLPVHSLYGERRKPSPESLRGLDVLVYDIQDAGCRFYTYISTLGLVMEAASEAGLPVVVLDRPNPLGGRLVEGPLLDLGRESFTAYHRIPVRHGLTVGEIARLYKEERKLTCPLSVIAMEGWSRGMLYEATGLEWVSPSPNLRSLAAALLYPGVGLLETTNVSVGRGTPRPFEWIGAPWIDGRRLASALANEKVPGVRFVPQRLTPVSSTHQGKECGGVQIFIDDWARFRPLPLGMALATTLRRLYAEEWKTERYDVLLGHRATWDHVRKATPWPAMVATWENDQKAFEERRAKVLIYPDRDP